MTSKQINENPRTTDSIVFQIETPDASGCFSANPYRLDNVIIYFVERDFLGANWGEYEKLIEDETVLSQLEDAKKAVCDDPTETNLLAVTELQHELESSRLSQTFYYKDRAPVKILGSDGFPAWFDDTTDDYQVVNVMEDDDGATQYGHFTYEWSPEGSVRAGDYFICWTWTVNAGDTDKLSAHNHFKLAGDPRAAITIPTHMTADNKYNTLLERYLPEMYKGAISNTDITPQTTDKFNQAIADGFTFLEDMANQIIDLFDANALHESMLVYLSNLFNLRLKSSDPTLWRRQIKEAIPLFKKKGTIGGLEDAFAQAGMRLEKFTQFWQLVSPYTWQESFQVESSAVFELEKETIVTPINNTNFGLWIRSDGDSAYTELNKDYVTFELGEDFILRMTWIGDELSVPTELVEGDIIRVLYEYNNVPNGTEQTIEEYIRALPLGDQRDEADQDYPPKNWNVRLISEEDPLFDILIPVRHPYHDPLVFGMIRTEFPYGENIYNMEEYNGSTRPSFDACYIDKDFIDPCGSCISSSYSVDVAIEELTNDRILESQDILEEYTPFHAQLHSINFLGEVNEFVQSPVEEIDFLVTVDRLENILSGQANPFYHRVMEDGLTGNWIIDREDLADKTTVLSGQLGTAYNDHIILVAREIILADLGIIENGNILEVLSPSPNAGTYMIDKGTGNTARVTSTVIEPLNESQFTFNLSNVVYNSSATNITQDDLFKFSDSSTDFVELGVQTQQDPAAWKVLITAYSATAYEIERMVNGVIHLDDDGTLPVGGASGVSYTLLTNTDATVATSTTGVIEVERRGYVDLNDNAFVDIHQFIRSGDYLQYDDVEYRITDFDGLDFWIADWTNGDVAGVNINTRRRLLRNAIGSLGYKGLNLTTFADHEAEFEIVNGSNPPPTDQVTDDNKFKENYMFKIGEQFFKILIWDGVNVQLSGREQSWTTLTAGGTAKAYSLVHFPKKQVNVQFLVFDHLDRDGHDVIVREVLDSVDQTIAIVALSNGDNSIEESISQDEGISFVIERRSGDTEEGEI